MSKRRAVLLAVWVVGGWLVALAAMPRFRFWLEEHNQRTTGPSFGLANDAAMSVAAALDDPRHVEELGGAQPVEPSPKSMCVLTWTDRETTHVYARRAERTKPETVWRAMTVPGKALLGGYEAGLWAGDCREPGADYESPCTKVARVHLVARQELAVLPPTEAGATRPLLPGQCVLGFFAGTPGVVGRYRVTLPADREITVRAFVIPATAFLSHRLSLHGKEAPHVAGENTVFSSIGEGNYDLEVTLLPAVGGPDRAGQYSLQVHWGKAVGPRCPIPGFDEGNCYDAGAHDGGAR